MEDKNDYLGCLWIAIALEMVKCIVYTIIKLCGDGWGSLLHSGWMTPTYVVGVISIALLLLALVTFVIYWIILGMKEKRAR